MNTDNEMNSANAGGYFKRLIDILNTCGLQDIDKAAELIASTWKAGKQIITLGNGGSSLTAMHMIADWNKSIFLSSGLPFHGRTLVDNIGLLMAYGNDISFADIFVEQLKNILQPGDLVIAISGSGNSENVIRAVNYANGNKAITLGLCGFDGGKLKNISQHIVWINSNDMQLCEDVHSMIGHIVMQRFCKIQK